MQHRRSQPSPCLSPGRSAPEVSAETVHDRGNRLMPNGGIEQLVERGQSGKWFTVQWREHAPVADFVWHSHPEKPLSPTYKASRSHLSSTRPTGLEVRSLRQDGKTHADRAYEQKCSQVFEYQSPEVAGTGCPGVNSRSQPCPGAEDACGPKAPGAPGGACDKSDRRSTQLVNEQAVKPMLLCLWCFCFR